MKQEQFLDVASVDEARARWHAALDLAPSAAEPVALGEALGRVLAADVEAPGDVPAFDRSDVDGFAVRAADTFGASEREPRRLVLVGAPLEAGRVPEVAVGPGEATAIATGGVLPRGADAIVMVEETEVDDAVPGTVCVRRPTTPGARVSQAGSDVARGEVALRKGTRLSARETGTLAALGVAELPCHRRVRVAVVSTGDEIVPPGTPLGPGRVHDANATLLVDAVREMGGEAEALGIAADDAEAIRSVLREALARFDAVLLSGGTSKGGGDLGYRVLGEEADIRVHGVALKPGKPLCLAAREGRPVVVLPGFPTSAIFTFHAFVAPVLRRKMGLADEARGTVAARLARHARSVHGRLEFTLVSLVPGRDGLVAFPLGKGSGSVTTFARADGFHATPANVEYREAGESVEVTLLGRGVEPSDLIVVGSHCPGVDVVLGPLHGRVARPKVLAVGSHGGVAAAAEGACDLAPVHLLDPGTGRWNAPFAPAGVRLLAGYGRRQGLAFREADRARYEAGEVEAVLFEAASDPERRLAQRNPGSGTRVLVDGLLERGGGAATRGERTVGYRSHTAVAAAIAQGRADFGICLEQAARAAGLGWRDWRPERLDFLVPEERWDRPGVAAFREALAASEVRQALAAAGFDVEGDAA